MSAVKAVTMFAVAVSAAMLSNPQTALADSEGYVCSIDYYPDAEYDDHGDYGHLYVELRANSDCTGWPSYYLACTSGASVNACRAENTFASYHSLQGYALLLQKQMFEERRVWIKSYRWFSYYDTAFRIKFLKSK